ncbi:MAG TPA: cation diffusion facilitator family transporter [Streptosporangiaceae bacterium]|nr:cation diffusion facilitator family transporter [Streptosporangiaceae bacterium]
MSTNQAGSGQGAGGDASAHGGGHPDSPRAVVAALAANLGIAATKFAAFVVTGSASMLAESVHSVADSGNQVLLLIGQVRSKRAETEEHPFGFGAERYVYAFIVAVVLFVVGAIFSLYEGISRIRHPEAVVSPVVAFAVLAVAVTLEAFSFRTAIRESNRTRDGSGWRAFIRHAKAPELPVVLLEDFAALIGLGFALLAVTLTTVTGDARWDGAGSLAIGLLLGGVAVVLAVEMKSLLVGEAARPEAQREIVAAIERGSGIERVIHLRTLHVGPESLLVAAKVAVSHGENAEHIASAIDQAEQRVREAVPIAGLIFLEPDLFQAAKLDVTDPAVRAAAEARAVRLRRAPGKPRKRDSRT